MLFHMQSSHKLQVILVCDEALSRITYSARTVDVGPLTAPLATEMVVDAQPDVTEVRVRGDCRCCRSARALTVMRVALLSPLDWRRLTLLLPCHRPLATQRRRSAASWWRCAPARPWPWLSCATCCATATAGRPSSFACTATRSCRWSAA
jgi:hypothetical protein